MPIRLRRRRRRAILVALVLALVAACSGGDSSGPAERSDDETTTSTTADPVSATSTSADGDAVETDGAAVELLRIALPGVDSLDPVAASPAAVADLVLADLLYDTLTVVDDAGRVRPGLATFAANADRTVWRFTLDGGPTFADGTLITPDDVVYSLRRVLDQGDRSLAALRVETITDIRVAGSDAVDIELRSPSAVLPEALSSPLYAITDDLTMQAYLEGGDQTPNASGAYVAVIEQARRLRLERRRGSGPLEISVELPASDDEALDRFLTDDVDWTIFPPDRIGEALDVAGADGLQPFQGILLLGLDSATPPVDRLELRRAIAHAIDRDALADAVFGETALPLAGVVPLGVPGGDRECAEPCGPDPDAAASAASAAFPEGQDRAVRLLVDDSAAQRAVAGVLKDQIETAAGIEIEVDALDASTYEALVASGQQQLFVFGWVGVARSPASYLAPLFASTSPDNVVDFADDAVDLQIAAAIAEPIDSVRARRWRDVEAEILRHVPVVPLVQFRTIAASRPSLTGLVVRADGSLDLRAVQRQPVDD